MDLWVRSQGKMKLIKVNFIYVVKDKENIMIYGKTNDDPMMLGVYKRKETVLKIFDEIQKSIKLETSKNRVLYEMPEKEEKEG